MERHAGIRDHLAGDKAIHAFLAAYLAATNYYLFHSERELGGAKRRPHIRYRGLALVYHGWKLAHAEAVEAE